jgi:hypothetical protein
MLGETVATKSVGSPGSGGLSLGERRADDHPTDDGGRRLPLARVAARILSCTTAGVLGAYPLARGFARWRRDSDPDYGEDIPLTFDINTEATIPTWYNAALLLAVAVLCGLFAALRRLDGLDHGWRWLVLGSAYALMSLDETVSLHERLGPRAAQALDLHEAGLLRHAWVVAGVGLALAFAIVAAWALVTLPRMLRRRMIAGLGVYLTGALAAEAVSGAVLDAHGDGWAYLAVTLGEEGAELAGAAIVLCALLAAIDVRVTGSGGLRLRLAAELTVRPRAIHQLSRGPRRSAGRPARTSRTRTRPA